MKKTGFFFPLFFISLSFFSEIFPQIPDQIQKYRAELYGSFQARKQGILDGNNIRSLFRNTGEIAEWPFQPSLEWPKGTGHSYLDGMTLLIGAEVTAPYLQIIHPIEASYREEMDQDPVTGEIWGLEPIPGYSNSTSTSPAINTIPQSWPNIWPDALGLPSEFNGNFPSYFGLNSNRAYETFFVMDDSRDKEFVRAYGFLPVLSDTNRGGLGLRVETRYLQFKEVELQNVLFMKYKITNISDFSYDKTCFGFYADPGVGGLYDNTDNVSYNKSLDLTYAWDSDGKGVPDDWITGYLGFAFLATPNSMGLSAASFVNLAHTPSNPWPRYDEVVWNTMIGGFADTSIINTNVNMVFSSGPFSLPKFSTDSIAAAIICADNLEGLFFTTKVAKQFYTNDFSLGSTVGNVILNLAKPTFKEKVSGILPIQYSLTNYTGAATHYIYHFTPSEGWILLGADANNSGYFYWETNSVKDGILHQIKIITITDKAVLSINSGFFTIQNNPNTKPEIYIYSPSFGQKLSANAVVKYYAGDADGNSGIINFFYKADPNSIPSLISSALTEKDSLFTWNSSNSANSITGELLGQIISGSDTTFYSVQNLTIENERTLPDKTNYFVGRRTVGTGDVELHVINPLQISGDDYLMVFDSANFDKATLYYKLYNKTKSNTFVGDVFEVQNGVESSLFDGLRIVANNDIGNKAVKESLTKWVVGSSNTSFLVTPDISSKRWDGEEDYQIEFYNFIVDTTYINASSDNFRIFPINFRIKNITQGRYTKIAVRDLDYSNSLTIGDEIFILEFFGEQTLSNVRISWRALYQESPTNPIPPAAGDVFRIVAKKEFVKGDSITFTTSGLVGVRDMDVKPSSFSLSQNYPNPFNPVTKIQFTIPQNEIVKIKVYDFLGAEITTLVNREMNSGSYEVDFNGKSLASGIYFVRMEAGKFIETKKIVLLK